MKNIPWAGMLLNMLREPLLSCVMAPAPFHGSWSHPRPCLPETCSSFLLAGNPAFVATFLPYFYLLLSLSLQQENHSSHFNRSRDAKLRPELGSWRRPGRHCRESWASSSSDRLPGPFWVPFIGVPDNSIHSKLPHGFKTTAQPGAI